MFSLIAKTTTLDNTLEKLEGYVKRNEFAHIISLNPENMVEAMHNIQFMHTYAHAEIVIADGIGILWAAHILGMLSGERITGVYLIRKLVSLYPHKKIVFVGGHDGVAQKTLDKLSSEEGHSGVSWVAFGDVDKNDPDIISHVMAEKPDFVFVAFGSPFQELWIEHNRAQLTGAICMGVGQGFDVIAGKVKHAPQLMRAMGFEWLFRLLTQPWRWKRQLRLFKFIYLVMRYRITRK